jgi:hypothetical protein
MITGPEGLAARLSGGEGQAFADLLASALPPLMHDDGVAQPADSVAQDVVKGLADLLDAVQASADHSPSDVENSWRSRLPAVALGVADHPADEPDPAVTGPALAEAAARVTPRAGRTPDGVWCWARHGEKVACRLVGGLLTGHNLAAIIGALAASARSMGVEVSSATVAEENHCVAVAHQARLGAAGRGTRLGLGCRLGRSAIVMGRVVRVKLTAHTESDKGWAAYLAAVERAGRRAVPTWCEVRVRVAQLSGPGVSELGGSYRLGQGLSLSRPAGGG